MRTTNFPLCCQAEIISSFPDGDRVGHYHRGKSIKWVIEDVARRMYNSGGQTMLAITNEDQHKAEKALFSLGWKCVDTSFNYRHYEDAESVYNKNPLKLWTVALQDPKVREKMRQYRKING